MSTPTSLASASSPWGPHGKWPTLEVWCASHRPRRALALTAPSITYICECIPGPGEAVYPFRGFRSLTEWGWPGIVFPGSPVPSGLACFPPTRVRYRRIYVCTGHSRPGRWNTRRCRDLEFERRQPLTHTAHGSSDCACRASRAHPASRRPDSLGVFYVVRVQRRYYVFTAPGLSRTRVQQRGVHGQAVRHHAHEHPAIVSVRLLRNMFVHHLRPVFYGRSSPSVSSSPVSSSPVSSSPSSAPASAGSSSEFPQVM